MKLPPVTRSRLNLLYALLPELIRSGRVRATSRDLGRWLGATAATIRKDLAWLTQASTGAAYDLSNLAETLSTLFEPPRPIKVAIVGLGEEGLATWRTLKQSRKGRYEVTAGFESRLNRLEQLDLPFSLHPTTEITPVCLRGGIELAFICIDEAEAQRCAERLVQGGVHRLVNYSNAVLRVNRHQVNVRECGVWAEAPDWTGLDEAP